MKSFQYSSQKKVKLSEIAAVAGVSNTAVSRFVNNSGYVSSEKQQKILHAMQTLGIEFSGSECKKRGPNKKTFGILLPPLNNNAQFVRMSSFFQSIARSYGYSVREYHINLATDSLDDVLIKLFKDPLNGLFIPVVPMLELAESTVELISQSSIPIVIMSEFLHPYPQINSIMFNFDVGMELAVQCLLQTNCHCIALLAPPLWQSKSSALQRRAFLSCMQKFQIPATNYVLVEEAWKSEPSAEAGYRAAQRAFNQNPAIDGIFGWTDLYTSGILWYLYETGRRVPEDVHLVSMNDDYAPFLCPPLTTLVLPNDVICREAIDVLIQMQEPLARLNVKQIYLTPTLVNRKSV